MITPISDLVAGHPLLAGLPGEAVSKVVGCAQLVVFPAGAFLLREGEAAGILYLVRRGRVAIEVHAPERGPVSVETVGPGGVVGWGWLFPPYRWHFDARAVETTRAIAVDGTCLRAKAAADPQLGYELMSRMSAVLLDRLQATRMRLLDMYGSGRVG